VVLRWWKGRERGREGRLTLRTASMETFIWLTSLKQSKILWEEGESEGGREGCVRTIP
jgi:hypothetical protein